MPQTPSPGGPTDVPDATYVALPGAAPLTITTRIVPPPLAYTTAEASGTTVARPARWNTEISNKAYALCARPGGFNEAVLMGSGWSRDGAVVTVDTWVGDYAASSVIRGHWAAIPLHERRGILRGLAGQPDAMHASCMGLAVTVITADRRLAITQRSQRLSFPGMWISSAAEGISAADAPFGVLDLAAAARRAVAEELGFATDAPVTANALVHPENTNELKICASIDLASTNVTFADLIQLRASAPDSWEADAMDAVPLTVDAVRTALHSRLWLRSEQLAVAAAAADALGTDAEDLLSAR